MANLTFPTNPTNGQKYTFNGKVFEYSSSTGRWSATRAQLLGSLPDDVTIDPVTITLSSVNVDFTESSTTQIVNYTVDRDASISISNSQIANTGMASATLYTTNNTISITSGTILFANGIVSVTAFDGRNNVDSTITLTAVYNDPPTDITNLNGSYTLSTDGTATVLSLQATDESPPGDDVVITANVISGGTVATVSTSGNTFTITPQTNATFEGVLTIDFVATDSENQSYTETATFTLSGINIETLLANGSITDNRAVRIDGPDATQLLTGFGSVVSQIGTSSWPGGFGFQNAQMDYIPPAGKYYAYDTWVDYTNINSPSFTSAPSLFGDTYYRSKAIKWWDYLDKVVNVYQNGSTGLTVDVYTYTNDSTVSRYGYGFNTQAGPLNAYQTPEGVWVFEDFINNQLLICVNTDTKSGIVAWEWNPTQNGGQPVVVRDSGVDDNLSGYGQNNGLQYMDWDHNPNNNTLLQVYWDDQADNFYARAWKWDGSNFSYGSEFTIQSQSQVSGQLIDSGFMDPKVLFYDETDDDGNSDFFFVGWGHSVSGSTTDRARAAKLSVDPSTLAISWVDNPSDVWDNRVITVDARDTADGYVFGKDKTGTLVCAVENLTSGLLRYKSAKLTRATSFSIATILNYPTRLEGTAGIFAFGNYNSGYENRIVIPFNRFQNYLVKAFDLPAEEDTRPYYDGIALDTRSDNSSITIAKQNSIATGLSGLVQGTTYYIDSDGSLTTTDTGYKAGVALSTTTLYVDKG
jgi:hypothetical protein